MILNVLGHAEWGRQARVQVGYLVFSPCSSLSSSPRNLESCAAQGSPSGASSALLGQWVPTVCQALCKCWQMKGQAELLKEKYFSKGCSKLKRSVELGGIVVHGL